MRPVLCILNDITIHDKRLVYIFQCWSVQVEKVFMVGDVIFANLTYE